MSVSVQKADVWKRFSAYLFDIVIVFTIAVSAMVFFMSFSSYHESAEILNQETARYQQQFEQETGVKLNITKEEYNNLSEAEQKIYDETYEKFNKELAQKKEIQDAYQKIIYSLIVCGSLGLLVGNLAVYFVVPLFLKNGQTLGKKCFGLAVVRSNCVKMSTPILFIRCFVGQYAIETMFPVFLISMTILGQLGIVGLATLIAFVILQIGVMVSSATNSCIHDLLSDAIVVDIASQFIFDSYDELIEHEKAVALEKANELQNEASAL